MIYDVKLLVSLEAPFCRDIELSDLKLLHLAQ